MKRKNILFVCKYNKFRSQVAEQFFRKYNKNRKFSVKSAGIFKGLIPLDKNQQKVAREFGINIKKIPETISISNLRNVYLVVIVADDVPKDLFLYAGRYLQEVTKWKINDEFTSSEEDIRMIIKKIELNIKKLIKQLEDKK